MINCNPGTLCEDSRAGKRRNRGRQDQIARRRPEVEEEGTCKLLGTSSCGIKWGNARGDKLQENVPTPLPNDTTFQPM